MNVANREPLLTQETVYITHSHLKSMVNKIKPLWKGNDLDGLYKSPLNHILSKPELVLLSIYQELCEDPEQVWECYRSQAGKSQHGSRMVFVDQQPAYHADRDCERLRSDYVNFEVPVEVENHRDSGEKVRFLAFAQNNRALMEEDFDRFLVRLSAQFPYIRSLNRIQFPNSGIAEFNNLDLPELEQRIDALLINAEAYRQQSDEHVRIIKDLGFGSHTKLAKEKGGEILAIWHNHYKSNLKQLLMHYYRIKLNPELRFEGHLLNQLGFVPCRCNKGHSSGPIEYDL